jgi:murein L,D-transpeptidase YcbB/YkuD
MKKIKIPEFSRLKNLSKMQKFFCVLLAFFCLFFIANSLFFSPPKQNITSNALLYDQNEVKNISAALFTHTDTLLSFSYFKDTVRRDNLAKQLLLWYKLHNFRLIWFPVGLKTNKADTLLQILENAPYEGLISKDYFGDSIVALSQNIRKEKTKTTFQELAKLDIYTSAALLSYGLHKKAGKLSTARNKYNTNFWADDQHFQDSLAMYFFKNMYQKGLKKTIESLTCQHPQYHLLKKELAKYIRFKERNIAPIVFDKDSSYQFADSSTAVFYLKKYLEATGDFPLQTKTQTNFSSNLTGLYDSTLLLAVQRFQYRNALEETGIANKETLKKINKISEECISKITINLERLKWHSYEKSPKKIRVNLPDFRVSYLENEQIIHSMPVVVGKKSSPTPIFKDTLEYVVFNPTWGVPHSIASKEMLYKLRSNKNYLVNNGYVLYEKGGKNTVDSRKINWFKITESNFAYSILQKSGKDNSLGKLKFLFPNNFHIYLHDTPEQKLFARKQRTYSHGCVRLECPSTMAFYVLRGVKDWDKNRISQALANNKIQHIALPPSHLIPIEISYTTAWVNTAGQLQLREDMYKYDKEQLKLFFE